ncbi:hypothetical protein V6N11_065935 [Hibiscus sabdariffa]|uniref:Uncharacterized protein n=2 Tax=Hibiscus sabdariffa TaxID=183260 RepID=A0ABR1Z898_9ROSI
MHAPSSLNSKRHTVVKIGEESKSSASPGRTVSSLYGPIYNTPTRISNRTLATSKYLPPKGTKTKTKDMQEPNKLSENVDVMLQEREKAREKLDVVLRTTKGQSSSTPNKVAVGSVQAYDGLSSNFSHG